MDIVLDDDGLERPLQQVAHTMMTPIRVLGKGTIDVPHKGGNVPAGSRDHQVKMISHQAVSKQQHSVPVDGLTENLQEPGPVTIAFEDDLLPIAAGHDVIARAFNV